MRDSRFRGIDVNTNQMVYGNLIENNDASFIVDKVDHSYIGYCCDCDRPYSGQYQVKPNTVGEYTGLKDINGIGIYVGDIVERRFMNLIDGAEFIGIVKKYDGSYYIDNDKEAYLLFHEIDETEVFGNVYEISELLERGGYKCFYSFTGATKKEIQMPESAISGIKEVKDIENSKREEYGKYKGHYKWDLTKAWFNMSNDAFYNKYGFNYHPHNDGNLYEECREFLSNNSISINTFLSANEIATSIERHLKRNIRCFDGYFIRGNK